jgi:hypothetical protein
VTPIVVKGRPPSGDASQWSGFGVYPAWYDAGPCCVFTKDRGRGQLLFGPLYHLTGQRSAYFVQ